MVSWFWFIQQNKHLNPDFFFSQLNWFLKCWLYLLVRQNNLEVILKNTIVKNCLEKGPIFACKICLKEGQKLLWIEWIRWVVASYFKNCLKKGPIFACKICLKEGQNFAQGPNCWEIIQIHSLFIFQKLPWKRTNFCLQNLP